MSSESGESVSQRAGLSSVRFHSMFYFNVSRLFDFPCQVNGKKLNFKAAVVATGGSAALPPIPGLAEAPYLTNASVFNLTELPKRLVSATAARATW